ncbi:Transposon Ty3-I Gag-Pol poly [Paramuricea clavata]|uniref:Transposon Ty3-I Gag-Pol poly n=1 Tax=Paramuricea clavata TaxID=317549 RepID=A0A7D9DHR6_PARCT|nr:Transposon Ty3-I Gag-Pol poly [Paramuricea clavata]
MLPFRESLKPGSQFTWTEELNQLFEESKKVIVNEIEHGVQIFDKSKPTCLATDWSKDGIGFWLFQKHCDCPAERPFCCKTGWKVTLVGSHFTHTAESRYAPIEGEALAVVDALDKARFFVLGCDNLIIAVDYKPLLKVFGDRCLEDISNIRLRNLKEKTLRYRFRMVHIPGIKHKAADALSRHPSGTTNPEAMPIPDDVADINANSPPPMLSNPVLAGIRTLEPDTYSITATIEKQLLSSAIKSTHSMAVTWDRVKTATASDTTMEKLLSTITAGFPEFRHELPPDLQEFFQFCEHLYAIDGVILYKARIVIPSSLRSHILSILHSAHQGITSMTSRAEATVFWPGITPAIRAIRESCQHCNRMAPFHPNPPPTPITPPSYPFQLLCADYFHYQGVNYLVVIDRYSNWPIIERCKDGATGLIHCLRRIFVTFGIPDELATDGGPEFTATSTQDFLTSWGVHHRLSSVAYPHSNCRAEVGVKTVKRLITNNTGPNGTLDTDTLQIAILQYRKTPDPTTKLSPAECIFGRPIKDFIPITPGRYQPHPTWKDTLMTREQALRNRHMQTTEWLSEHTRRLPPLKVGDQVRIQNQIGPHPKKWDKTGLVIEVRQFSMQSVWTGQAV